MVKKLPTKESNVNIGFKKIKNKNFNGKSNQYLVINELLRLKNFIKNKRRYINYYFRIKLDYKIILKESIKNITIFKIPVDLINLDEDINDVYDLLVDGEIIVLIAFCLFKNIQWVNIKTTKKEGWVIFNDEFADSIKLF